MKTFKFEIGKVGRKAVTMDALTLVDSRLLACANSGGGKSYLLRLLIECVGAKIPTIVLDPEGEFSTLREKLDMVLIGEDGDVDADPRSAALLCRKLVEMRLSAVIDLYALKLPERRRFVRVFLETLITLPRKLWGPTLIAIDEAHKMCPERGSGEAESTDAVISLMAQGRKRGYGGVLVTQRLSKLHKDAVGECNNVMIGRCVQDVDLKRSGDLLGLASTRSVLRGLKPGQFYGFGPAFTHDGIECFQANKVSTTHPDARSRHKLKPPAPSRSIQRILPELADLPARAHEEKLTLDMARAEVAKLEREIAKLKKQPGVRVDQAAVEKAVKQVNDSWLRRSKVQAKTMIVLERMANDLNMKAVSLHQALHAMGKEFQEMTAFASDKMLDDQRNEDRLKVTHTPRSFEPPPSARSRKKAELRSDADLKPSARKILSALALFPEGLTTSRLSTVTGLAARGGSYNTVMKDLRERGFVEGRGTMAITEAGMEAIADNIEHPPEPGDERVAFWRDKLKSKSAKTIFEAMVSSKRESFTTESVADMTGLVPRGGSFNTAMKELRDFDLIRGRGSFHLNPDLFR